MLKCTPSSKVLLLQSFLLLPNFYPRDGASDILDDPSRLNIESSQKSLEKDAGMVPLKREDSIASNVSSMGRTLPYSQDSLASADFLEKPMALDEPRYIEEFEDSSLMGSKETPKKAAGYFSQQLLLDEAEACYEKFIHFHNDAKKKDSYFKKNKERKILQDLEARINANSKFKELSEPEKKFLENLKAVSIDASGFAEIHTESLLSWLKNVSGLRVLNIHNYNFKSPCLSVLKEILNRNHGLEFLGLANCELTGEKLHELRHTFPKLKNMRGINFSNNNLKGAGDVIRDIIVHYPQLEILDLAAVSFGELEVKRLWRCTKSDTPRIPFRKTIRYINLLGNAKLTEISLQNKIQFRDKPEMLRPFGRLPNIEVVAVEADDNVTHRDILNFIARFIKVRELNPIKLQFYVSSETREDLGAYSKELSKLSNPSINRVKSEKIISYPARTSSELMWGSSEEKETTKASATSHKDSSQMSDIISHTEKRRRIRQDIQG